MSKVFRAVYQVNVDCAYGAEIFLKCSELFIELTWIVLTVQKYF